jgi:hypothetical protein
MSHCHERAVVRAFSNLITSGHCQGSGLIAAFSYISSRLQYIFSESLYFQGQAPNEGALS